MSRPKFDRTKTRTWKAYSGSSSLIDCKRVRVCSGWSNVLVLHTCGAERQCWTKRDVDGTEMVHSPHGKWNGFERHGDGTERNENVTVSLTTTVHVCVSSQKQFACVVQESTLLSYLLQGWTDLDNYQPLQSLNVAYIYTCTWSSAHHPWYS
jgi:hypothetical protein